MKRVMSSLLVLILVMPVRADDKADKDAEAKAKSLHESATKIIIMMKGIKDKESAEKSKSDLEKAFVDFGKHEEAFSKLPVEVRNKLREAWAEKFTTLKKDFKTEGDRLQKTPGVMTILAELEPFKKAREAKVSHAKILVMNLDKAVAAYKLTTGDYPKTLAILATSPGPGIEPFVPKEALKDAWDRPIQYDVAGKRNKGVKPDIWSAGPPEQPNALIGNWEAKK